MILESFLVLGVIGIILVFFYRQAVQEFRILQTESIEKATALFYERCPIVVLPAPAPIQLWTRADLQQRPSIQQYIIQDTQLSTLLEKESVQLQPNQGEVLATHLGLPVWVNQTLLPQIRQTSWWTPILWSRTEVTIGAQGLRQSYGYCTALFVTEGAAAVSLLNESSDSYLPAKWVGKRVSKFTRDDAPLLHQIQYIDVIVRPGSMLLLPPHWKVCWETHQSPKPVLAVWTEFHHPLSHFVRAASFRKVR
jgi:hypothetical protein